MSSTSMSSRLQAAPGAGGLTKKRFEAFVHDGYIYGNGQVDIVNIEERTKGCGSESSFSGRLT
jgi:hypothetical protein